MPVSDFFLEMLFPDRCVVCGRSDRLADGMHGFCLPCLAQIPFRRHADRVILVRTKPRLTDFPVMAATTYNPVMRRLLTRYKFHGEAGYHLALSSLVLFTIRAEQAYCPFRADGVLAVPLHAERLKERGFNQAGLLAADVAAGYHIADLSPILIRTRNTPRQTETVDHASRQANPVGAFAVSDPEAVRGRHLLLIDDILTTGATLSACHATLSQLSPASITGAVVSCGRGPAPG